MTNRIDTEDILNVIKVIPWLTLDMFSSRPYSKDTWYWFITIWRENTNTYSNKWFQIKEIRFSVCIYAPRAETLNVSEEKFIDNILNIITNWIVDKWKLKISKWWNCIWNYCKEESPTQLYTDISDRCYKIKDFLVWYETL